MKAPELITDFQIQLCQYNKGIKIIYKLLKQSLKKSLLGGIWSSINYTNSTNLMSVYLQNQ